MRQLVCACLVPLHNRLGAGRYSEDVFEIPPVGPRITGPNGKRPGPSADSAPEGAFEGPGVRRSQRPDRNPGSALLDRQRRPVRRPQVEAAASDLD